MSEQTSHTARVHAWYIDSDGVETHVTRRDDGKWYLNTIDPTEEATYVPVEAAADLYALAVEEGRPHGTIEGLPNAEKWTQALHAAHGQTETEEA